MSKGVGIGRGGTQDLNQAFSASYWMTKRTESQASGRLEVGGHLVSCPHSVGEEPEV